MRRGCAGRDRPVSEKKNVALVDLVGSLVEPAAWATVSRKRSNVQSEIREIGAAEGNADCFTERTAEVEPLTQSI